MMLNRHTTAHYLADKCVRLIGTALDERQVDQVYVVEDWWDRLAGKSWMVCDGNPACMLYAIRGGFGGLPADNEVVYGKINGLGHLIHVSELGEELPGTVEFGLVSGK